MIKKAITILMLAFIFSSQIKGQEIEVENYIEIGDEVYVFSNSGLNVRKSPNINSDVLFKLNYAQKVVVDSISNVYNEIDGRKGRWILINNNGNSGFIFSGYLSESQPPKFSKIFDGNFVEYSLEKWLCENTAKNSMLEFSKNIRISPFSGAEKRVTENMIQAYSSGSIIMRNQGWEWSQFKIVSYEFSLNDIMNFIDCYQSIYKEILEKENIRINKLIELKEDSKYMLGEDLLVTLNYNMIEIVIDYSF